MGKYEEALKSLEGIEKIKQAAIDELKGIIADAEDKLAKLGVMGGKRTRKSGERKCGNCGETGHNARSCPNPKKKGKAA